MRRGHRLLARLYIGNDGMCTPEPLLEMFTMDFKVNIVVVLGGVLAVKLGSFRVVCKPVGGKVNENTLC